MSSDLELTALSDPDKLREMSRAEPIPKFNQEILTLIDGFQGELGSLVSRRYGLLPGSLDSIQTLLHRHDNVNSFKPETRTICDSLKEPLSHLVEPGIFIDAEPNRFYQCVEVEVSHQPKSVPKEIKKGETVVALIRPGRGEREDLLVIGPTRIMLRTNDMEMDCSNSDGDPNKFLKGILEVLSNEPRYGIPYGKMMIVAETERGHRNHIRFVGTEDWNSSSNRKQGLIHVTSSVNLGTDIYYDVGGNLYSIGIYFEQSGQKIFGIYRPNEKPTYKTVSGILSKDKIIPDNEPTIITSGDTIVLERNSVTYQYDLHIDSKAILDNLLKILKEENNIVDV